MSIYGSWFDLDDWSDLQAPIIYQASHIMPTDDDPRGGSVDVAGIAGFIPRDGRALCDDYGRLVWPWLRLSVNDQATVILDRAQVVGMHEKLGEWLDRCPEVTP
jgi:hypothetical protein